MEYAVYTFVNISNGEKHPSKFIIGYETLDLDYLHKVQMEIMMTTNWSTSDSIVGSSKNELFPTIEFKYSNIRISEHKLDYACLSDMFTSIKI